MILINKQKGEYDPESYLVKTCTDNTYLLLIPNINEGYNYFDVYVDSESKNIHVFDSREKSKTGTTISCNHQFLTDINKILNLEDNYNFIIYTPGDVNKVLITTYNGKDNLNENVKMYEKYIPFVRKAEMFSENKF
ncbi:hypothetical protein [Clostridium perfringens]